MRANQIRTGVPLPITFMPDVGVRVILAQVAVGLVLLTLAGFVLRGACSAGGARRRGALILVAGGAVALPLLTLLLPDPAGVYEALASYLIDETFTPTTQETIFLGLRGKALGDSIPFLVAGLIFVERFDARTFVLRRLPLLFGALAMPVALSLRWRTFGGLALNQRYLFERIPS